jgi:hypothetical protein
LIVKTHYRVPVERYLKDAALRAIPISSQFLWDRQTAAAVTISYSVTGIQVDSLSWILETTITSAEFVLTKNSTAKLSGPRMSKQDEKPSIQSATAPLTS